MTSISGMGPPHPTSNDNTKPLPCLDHHPTRKSSKRVQFDLDRNHYYNNVHGITMEHKGQLWYSPSDFGHFATCLWHDQQAMLKWTTNTKGLSFPSNKEEDAAIYRYRCVSCRTQRSNDRYGQQMMTVGRERKGEEMQQSNKAKL